MATFEILSSRALEDPERSSFIVSFEKGELVQGETFTCYDTHHSVAFQVILTAAVGKHTELICRGPVSFKNQFAGAVVNSSANDRAQAFWYKHAPRPA